MGQNDKIREAAEEIFEGLLGSLPVNYKSLYSDHREIALDQIMGIIEGVNNSLVQKVLRLEDENEHLRKKVNPYERNAIRQHNISGDSGGF